MSYAIYPFFTCSLPQGSPLLVDISIDTCLCSKAVFIHYFNTPPCLLHPTLHQSSQSDTSRVSTHSSSLRSSISPLPSPPRSSLFTQFASCIVVLTYRTAVSGGFFFTHYSPGYCFQAKQVHHTRPHWYLSFEFKPSSFTPIAARLDLPH